MEQEVRFSTAAGRRIAYAIVGTGPAIVFPASWVSHVELAWENSAFRAFFSALATRHTVIHYDPLGTGLSARDRHASKLSLDSEVETLDQLLNELELERCSLFGSSAGGPIAGAYAAAHPERISRLILYGTYAEGSRLTDLRTREMLITTAREHWGLGSRVLASVFLPDAGPEDLRWFSQLQREAATPEVAARRLSLVYEAEAVEAYRRVSAPTLVVHRRDDRAIGYEHGLEVAALVPASRLESLGGSAHLPWLGDPASVLDAVARFMRLGAYPFDSPGTQTDGPASVESLTQRELEILRLVATGLTDRMIAERLTLSPHTVRRHVANIRRKLGQRSRAAAATAAARLGLI
jgi:pimeloyl-ACP methyl ester carboxylesterase/DNA-binding CsgD family transcriptional regulator